MMPALKEVKKDELTVVEVKLYELLKASQSMKKTSDKITTVTAMVKEFRETTHPDFAADESVIWKSLLIFVLEAQRRYKRAPHGWVTSHSAMEDFEKILMIILVGKSGQKYQCLHLQEGACTRLLHLFDTAHINFKLARKMGVDSLLAWLIGLIHDSAQIAWSHRGEKAIQRISGENISHEIDVAEIFGSAHVDIRIIDGGASHCGEHFAPSRKVDRDKEMTLRNIKSSFRAQTAGTIEGVLVLYADKIAFVFRDIQDGFRFNVVSWERYKKYRALDAQTQKMVKDLYLSDHEMSKMRELAELVENFSDEESGKDLVRRLIEEPISTLSYIRERLLERIAQSSTKDEVRFEEADYEFFNQLQDWKEKYIYISQENLWTVWKVDEKVYQFLLTLKGLMVEKRLKENAAFTVVGRLLKFLEENDFEEGTHEYKILSRFLLLMGDQELLDYYDELKSGGILRK